jgi:hypothetical protein
MLDTACQQALALDHDGLAQPINAPRSRVLCPPQRIPHRRDGKASFLVFLLTLDGLNHRVDKMPDLAIDVVRKNAAAHPNLVSSQAGTPRRRDGLFQIGHQADECLIEPVNGIAGGAEHWITQQTDRTLGHRAILPLEPDIQADPAGLASGFANNGCGRHRTRPDGPPSHGRYEQAFPTTTDCPGRP